MLAAVIATTLPSSIASAKKLKRNTRMSAQIQLYAPLWSPFAASLFQPDTTITVESLCRMDVFTATGSSRGVVLKITSPSSTSLSLDGQELGKTWVFYGSNSKGGTKAFPLFNGFDGLGKASSVILKPNTTYKVELFYGTPAVKYVFTFNSGSDDTAAGTPDCPYPLAVTLPPPPAAPTSSAASSAPSSAAPLKAPESASSVSSVSSAASVAPVLPTTASKSSTPSAPASSVSSAARSSISSNTSIASSAPAAGTTSSSSKSSVASAAAALPATAAGTSTQRTLFTFLTNEWTNTWYAVSPSGNHYTKMAATTPSKLTIDGGTPVSYPSIDGAGFWNSDESRLINTIRTALSSSNFNTAHVLTNGTTVDPNVFAWFGDMTFSTDGTHFAYVGATDVWTQNRVFPQRSTVVVDGTPIYSAPLTTVAGIAFSANGRHFGYTVRTTTGSSVVVDGIAAASIPGAETYVGPPWTNFTSGNPVGAGSSVAVLNDGTPVYTLVTENEISTDPITGRIFNTQFVAGNRRGTVQQGKLTRFVLSTDETKVAGVFIRYDANYKQNYYIYQWNMATGTESLTGPFWYASDVAFSPDSSKLAYMVRKHDATGTSCAVNGTQEFCIPSTDTHNSPLTLDVTPVFSPNGSKIAYGKVLTSGAIQPVLNGTAVGTAGWDMKFLRFSRDGKSLSYVVTVMRTNSAGKKVEDVNFVTTTLP